MNFSSPTWALGFCLVGLVGSVLAPPIGEWIAKFCLLGVALWLINLVLTP